MIKKKRVVFISFLTILFITASYLIVFYALGWRLDWTTKRIIQPGAFYFKVLQSGAQIYINDQFKKKTDFFFNSAYVDNIPSGRYKVSIKKEGFHDWEKSLEVDKREVTEVKNTVLIPNDPGFSNTDKDILDIYASDDGKRIVLYEDITASSSTSNASSWALKLIETDTGIKSQIITEKDILNKISKKYPGRKTKVADLKFSTDSRALLLKASIGNNYEYFVLEIDHLPPVITYLDSLPLKSEVIGFNPQDYRRLLILKDNILNEIYFNGNRTTSPSIQNIIAYYLSSNGIYFLDKSGVLSKSDFYFNRIDRLNEATLPMQNNAEIRIKANDTDVVIKENQDLYLLSDKKSLDKMASSVRDFEFSPDQKKLLYFTDNDITVLFLKKEYGQPEKEKNEKASVAHFQDKIGDVYWYTSFYLVFSVSGKIKVTEIDDRDKINMVDVADFKDPQLFWSDVNKSIYVVSENNLFVSNKMIQ